MPMKFCRIKIAVINTTYGNAVERKDSIVTRAMKAPAVVLRPPAQRRMAPILVQRQKRLRKAQKHIAIPSNKHILQQRQHPVLNLLVMAARRTRQLKQRQLCQGMMLPTMNP